VTAQRDPLGLTDEQRRISDANERYGPWIGKMLVDFPEGASGLLTVLDACPHCRQIQGHAPGCLTNLTIDGEWFS